MDSEDIRGRHAANVKGRGIPSIFLGSRLLRLRYPNRTFDLEVPSFQANAASHGFYVFGGRIRVTPREARKQKVKTRTREV